MTTKINFNKNISTFSLTMTGVTSILGSGWLLSTQKIANIAGPAGLISWVIGMGIALMVAMFYVEIGSAHPSAGGIGYYSHITHGRFCGFITSWVNWLSVVAVPAIEAQAIVQYLSQLTPALNMWYNVDTHSLTGMGIATAVALLLLFMFINYWSVQLFLRFNNFFTIIKILVPLMTICVLVYSGIHPQNFGSNFHEFAPFGWHGVFVCVISSGVVMSFNGFQTPMTFSEEISSPRKMLPIAVAGSILLAFVVYILLQAVFIGSIDPLLVVKGWQTINYRSPYAELLIMLNLHWMALVVYFSSVVSPAACGAAFTASSSRILYALSKEKHLPAYLNRLHPIYFSPRNAIISCVVIGCIFLFLFKGWYSLVAVISILHIFSYLSAPIVTMANRIKHCQSVSSEKQFRLPFAHVLAPLTMFILSVLLFYASWPITAEMALLIVPGLLLFLYYENKYYKNEGSAWKLLKGASWIFIYLFGISFICYLGDNPDIGTHQISLTHSMILLAILSITVYIYGAYFAYDKGTYHSGK